MKTPKMQRAHFELIARCLRDAIELASESQQNPAGHRILIYLAHSLACELRQTNIQFNRDRFLTACGLDARERATV